MQLLDASSSQPFVAWSPVAGFLGSQCFDWQRIDPILNVVSEYYGSPKGHTDAMKKFVTAYYKKTSKEQIVWNDSDAVLAQTLVDVAYFGHTWIRIDHWGNAYAIGTLKRVCNIYDDQA